MTIQRIFLSTTVALALTFSYSAYSAWWSFSDDDDTATEQMEMTELQWDDLIPDDFVQPVNPFTTMSRDEIDKLMDGSAESKAELDRLQSEFDFAPVVPELDGKRVKIPAYITPLEFSEDSSLKEFLLVPYVGACMHTPPPPSNQIVHAQSPEAIKFSNMYDPVWAVGIIRTETVKSDLAESGYRLEVESVMPYRQR